MIDDKDITEITQKISRKSNELSSIVLQIENQKNKINSDSINEVKNSLIEKITNYLPNNVYRCNDFNLLCDRFTTSLNFKFDESYDMSILRIRTISSDKPKYVIKMNDFELEKTDNGIINKDKLDAYNSFIHIIENNEKFWEQVKEVLDSYYTEYNKGIIEIESLQNKKSELSREISKLNMAKIMLKNTIAVKNEGKPGQYVIVNKIPKVVGTAKLKDDNGVLMEIISTSMDDDKEAWRIAHKNNRLQNKKGEKDIVKYHVYDIKKIHLLDEPVYF